MDAHFDLRQVQRRAQGGVDLRQPRLAPERSSDHPMARHSPQSPMFKKKMKKVMGEFAEGTLHSGGPEGKKVTSRKQAVASGLSEARKATRKRKRT